jgi:hypothetical protein
VYACRQLSRCPGTFCGDGLPEGAAIPETPRRTADHRIIGDIADLRAKWSTDIAMALKAMFESKRARS